MRCAIMRYAHGWALAAGLVVLAAGVVKWYASREAAAPPLQAQPAELTWRESGPLPALAPLSEPAPRVSPAPRPFEPIAVLAEPFTDPLPQLPEAASGGLAEERSHAELRPNPRPETFVLRMPYADEELSEFALLLQRAAQYRQTAPTAPPFPAAAEAAPAKPPE